MHGHNAPCDEKWAHMGAKFLTMDQVKLLTIKRRLEVFHFHRAQTAMSLGVTLRTIYNAIAKLRKMGHVIPNKDRGVYH